MRQHKKGLGHQFDLHAAANQRERAVVVRDMGSVIHPTPEYIDAAAWGRPTEDRQKALETLVKVAKTGLAKSSDATLSAGMVTTMLKISEYTNKMPTGFENHPLKRANRDDTAPVSREESKKLIKALVWKLEGVEPSELSDPHAVRAKFSQYHIKNDAKGLGQG